MVTAVVEHSKLTIVAMYAMKKPLLKFTRSTSLPFQVEINRKREIEITKMRSDLEAAQNALELESETMRRRHQQTVAEMADQIEALTRQKNKLVSTYKG